MCFMYIIKRNFVGKHGHVVFIPLLTILLYLTSVLLVLVVLLL